MTPTTEQIRAWARAAGLEYSDISTPCWIVPSHECALVEDSPALLPLIAEKLVERIRFQAGPEFTYDAELADLVEATGDTIRICHHINATPAQRCAAAYAVLEATDGQ